MKMSTSGNYYTVETVAGMEGSTITYEWKIVHNDAGNLAYLGNRQDSSTVELIFNGDILNKGALVGNPGVADTIVLQCTVKDGLENYVLQRTITVGDRDECSPAAGLLDAEGNSYTVSRFGGVCWMTQNLRSTWTKQGNQVQTISEKNVDDPNVVVYSYPHTYTVANLPPGYGFLYTWGAANIGTETTEATNAFINTTSNRQGICPDGWTLPSDYDWNQLEKAIATKPGLYSTERDTIVEPAAWNSNHETITGWRPDGGNTKTSWGRRMKSPTNGVSKTDGTGFNALLVGINNGLYFGSDTYFWSSSAGSATAAWRRNLHSGVSGTDRNISGKTSMFSVRCKK
jgi:uncharacterized protein (TIGR02145 family)